ncbi:MAG: 1,6-anhydro-N-acetylmuramyl-L-alanine amidase AmpD [Methylococcaceae bacterium]|nr:1,6-anhydro-N-acetylmuramyl-L-alanine amidase AmpD [Methylococcaceae bacterium]
MNIINHLLLDSAYIDSPNCDDRPDPTDISLIVIHCISLPPGEYDNLYIDQLFCNQLNGDDHPYFKNIFEIKVSAHLLIKRDGACVQYVPFNLRAWHAGVSSYQGRERCNDYSIGIELEGTEQSSYTEIQYRRLAEVIEALLKNYPALSKQRITGHSDIAPGRKTDPGASFEWTKLFDLLV